MKKLFIVMLALILLLGLGTTLANAEAIKVPLFLRADTCATEAGWVIVNKNAAGEIIVEVSLKKVVEINAKFIVFIVYEGWSWPGDDDADGEFMTNKVGNGNCHCTIDSDELEWVKVIVRKPGDSSSEGYGTCEEICLVALTISPLEGLDYTCSIGTDILFTSTTTNPSPPCGQNYSRVLFNYTIYNIKKSDIESFEAYWGDDWHPQPMEDVDGNVEGYFGPSPDGFPMEAPYNETTELMINIKTAGTYNFVIELVNLDTGDVLAILTQDVVFE